MSLLPLILLTSTLITSTSPQKVHAVLHCLPEEAVIALPSNSGVANQPFGYEEAVRGAVNRIVSIENYVEYNSAKERYEDKAVIVVSRGIPVPKEAALRSLQSGQTKTCGSFIDPENPQDWHRRACGMKREEIISEALFKALHAEEIAKLKEKITLHADFPQKGVLFQNFIPILCDAESFKLCLDLLQERFEEEKIDAVMGLESRGFILGAALADRLGAAFVPARKPGKLPGEHHSASYSKEYGTDTLNLAKDSLKAGSRVLIIDDLIATGGTARAAIELVKKAECSVACFVSLLEVAELDGRLSLGVPSFNLIE